MTNSKTRLRVARIAAGAVFAAGASLTAAGVAQAVSPSEVSDDTAQTASAKNDIGVVEGADEGGAIVGINEGATEGDVVGVIEGNDGGADDGGADDGGADDGGADDGGADDGGADDGGADDGGADDGGADDGGADDGGADDGGADDGGNGNGGNANGGNGNGGNGGSGNGGNGGNGGGEEPATIGGSGGGGDDTPTCELSESEVDCADGGNTKPDVGGSEPVNQEKPKDELAETGSAETTFLLVGAATMIAGGVGFRVMPRMLNRRTVA